MNDKVKTKVMLDIEKKIKNILDINNISLVDIDIYSGNEKHITIYIYKENINITDTANISKRIFPLIDQIPFFENAFTLEVSTPGVNRKIKSKQEFNIFIGRNIKIITVDQTYTGICMGLNNDLLKINKNNSDISISINDIKKAKLID